MDDHEFFYFKGTETPKIEHCNYMVFKNPSNEKGFHLGMYLYDESSFKESLKKLYNKKLLVTNLEGLDPETLKIDWVDLTQPVEFHVDENWKPMFSLSKVNICKLCKHFQRFTQFGCKWADGDRCTQEWKFPIYKIS